ncbi:MAG: hypothetical protein ACK4V2_00100 [Pseudomonadota bacterium]|jgi:hypothetical protein|nr:hypothetical protein [Alphaproteobacteria bacterium]
MKLTHLLSAAVITAVTVSSLSAIDGEFTNMNPTQAKMAATKLKTEVARLRGLGGAAAHHGGLAGTDTDALLQTIGADTQLYINAIKAPVIAAFNAFVDTVIVGADGTAFFAGAPAGGHGVADQSKGALKAGFAAQVNATTHAALAAHGAAVPVDASMHALNASVQSVNVAMGAAFDAWLDLLFPGADNTVVLDAATVIGGATVGDLEKGTFKAAILGAISQ